ncbi:coiled-coil domain-containing protein 42-like [Procambarus clarkii]|uniref:coiled-coil domain-containing protein 42-like n=1 Tax=Procambarus clarkii TaxID=6728 RepID=UPI0037425A75
MEDVIKQVVKLKPNKSPGPDEVFAKVLKECKEERDEGKIDSETHENYFSADRHALTTIKLKLELAKIEREQQKDALQIRKEEAAIKEEEQERESALKKEQQEREVALKEHEMALKKEETALLQERERVQLEARQRYLEMQCEHDKK